MNRFYFFILMMMLCLAACTVRQSLDNVSLEVLSSEFVYDSADFPSCHASTLVETENGLLADWLHRYDKEVAALGTPTPEEAACDVLLLGSSSIVFWNTVAEDLTPLQYCDLYRVFCGKLQEVFPEAQLYLLSIKYAPLQ